MVPGARAAAAGVGQGHPGPIQHGVSTPHPPDRVRRSTRRGALGVGRIRRCAARQRSLGPMVHRVISRTPSLGDFRTAPWLICHFLATFSQPRPQMNL